MFAVLRVRAVALISILGAGASGFPFGVPRLQYRTITDLRTSEEENSSSGEAGQNMSVMATTCMLLSDTMMVMLVARVKVFRTMLVMRQ